MAFFTTANTVWKSTVVDSEIQTKIFNKNKEKIKEKGFNHYIRSQIKEWNQNSNK